MIEIVQAGQSGKTRLLFDMHRLRKRVFCDRLGWPVPITKEGLEVDQFDLPETIYLLSLNNLGKVVGSWRLLPTDGPTMIRDVWPEFLSTISMPSSNTIWEASRFCVDDKFENIGTGINQINTITCELFCALTELSILCGIKQIYTLYDLRISRLLRRLDCVPQVESSRIKIDDHVAQVGCFNTDIQMLNHLRKATGIMQNLVDCTDLPPSFQKTSLHNFQPRKSTREEMYGNA